MDKTIVFQFDFSPRKKGEEFTPNSSEEERIAEWYLANGIAKYKCDCTGDNHDCADCRGKNKSEIRELVDEPIVISTEGSEEVKPKKTSK